MCFAVHPLLTDMSAKLICFDLVQTLLIYAAEILQFFDSTNVGHKGIGAASTSAPS